MKKIYFYSYGNSGGIDKVDEYKIKHKSYNDLVSYYKNQYELIDEIGSFNLKPYCYDTRLKTNVMMLINRGDFISFVVVHGDDKLFKGFNNYVD